ncbi:MAG TPA: hypothetical protein DGT21_01170 [Armatimonadetes bacterium]|nr:hypothetical protein [Armatimonadota bacterium]
MPGRDMPGIGEPGFADQASLLDFYDSRRTRDERLAMVAAALQIEDPASVHLWPALDAALEEFAWQTRLGSYAQQLETAVKLKKAEDRTQAIRAVAKRIKREMAWLLPKPAEVRQRDVMTAAGLLDEHAARVVDRRRALQILVPAGVGKPAKSVPLTSLGGELATLADHSTLHELLSTTTIPSLEKYALTYAVGFTASETAQVELAPISRESLETNLSDLLTGVEGYIEAGPPAGPTSVTMRLTQPHATAWTEAAGADKGSFRLEYGCEFFDQGGNPQQMTSALLGGFGVELNQPPNSTAGTLPIVGKVVTWEGQPAGLASVLVHAAQSALTTGAEAPELILRGVVRHGPTGGTGGSVPPVAPGYLIILRPPGATAVSAANVQCVETDEQGRFGLKLPAKLTASVPVATPRTVKLSGPIGSAEARDYVADVPGYFAFLGLPPGSYSATIEAVRTPAEGTARTESIPLRFEPDGRVLSNPAAEAERKSDAEDPSRIHVSRGYLLRLNAIVRPPADVEALAEATGSFGTSLWSAEPLGQLSSFQNVALMGTGLFSSAPDPGLPRLGIADVGGKGAEGAYFYRYPLNKDARERAKREYVSVQDVSVTFSEAKSNAACPEGDERHYVRAHLTLEPTAEAVSFALRSRMHHPWGVSVGYSNTGDGDAYLLGLSYSPIRRLDIMAGVARWSEEITAEGDAGNGGQIQYNNDIGTFWGISYDLSDLIFR